MRRGPPDQSKSTCLLRGVITVQIEPRGEHPDRRIKIQRMRLRAFLKRLSTDQIPDVHQDRTATT